MIDLREALAEIASFLDALLVDSSEDDSEQRLSDGCSRLVFGRPGGTREVDPGGEQSHTFSKATRMVELQDADGYARFW
jgi:hypothetical protein